MHSNLYTGSKQCQHDYSTCNETNKEHIHNTITKKSQQHTMQQHKNSKQQHNNTNRQQHNTQHNNMTTQLNNTTT